MDQNDSSRNALHRPSHGWSTAQQALSDGCDSYAKSTVGTVLASFDELSGRKDYKGIYLFLSLQYDQLRKPLPDPVWWLMGSPKALKIFSIGFVESLTEVFREEESYVQADDRNAQ